MRQINASIITINVLGTDYYYFQVMAPEIAAEAKPGQFVQIRVAEPGCRDPLLARPISIFSLDRQQGTISFIFKIVGRGTDWLAKRQAGSELTILGPLGKGFNIPEGASEIALLAGGVGMPPLFCLAEDLKAKQPGRKITLFYGGRTKNDLLELERWGQTGAVIKPTTEDGSYGWRGLVTDCFFETISQVKYDFLAACGPLPMLKAIQQIAGIQKIPGQVSLEAYMACGVGACLGCVCQTNSGFQRVCIDGPVFSVDEVVF